MCNFPKNHPRLQEKALPSAHLAKAFNTIGFAHMANPAPGGKPLQMLFAASAGAKALAHRVIEGESPELSCLRRYILAHLLCTRVYKRAYTHVCACCADVGFKPEYVGGMRFSRNLESICELWVSGCDTQLILILIYIDISFLAISIDIIARALL